MLVPVDFSASSRRALAEALSLNGYSSILLLHVVTEPVAAHQLKRVMQSTHSRLREFCRGDGEMRPALECHVRLGVAFREILRFAEEKHVDLIVLVGDEEPKRALGEGHTADRIARYATCAVMLVRPA